MTNNTEMTIAQGQVVEIMIADLTDSGEGVGRTDDRVVFVPDTVPGDRVSVRLVQVKRQYAHGKLLQVLDPAPQRRRSGCIVSGSILSMSSNWKLSEIWWFKL
jgi:23S rRNA (uracil1939-C5)-methyltransferase